MKEHRVSKVPKLVTFLDKWHLSFTLFGTLSDHNRMDSLAVQRVTVPNVERELGHLAMEMTA